MSQSPIEVASLFAKTYITGGADRRRHGDDHEAGTFRFVFMAVTKHT